MDEDEHKLPDFFAPQLVERIEAMTLAEIDHLPYEVAHVNRDGIVDIHHTVERETSRSGDLPRLGADHFTKVAPWLDTPDLRDRIMHMCSHGGADMLVSRTAEVDGEKRRIGVKIQPATASGEGCWIFTRWGG